ncbi:TniQ family protein [Pseudomonas nicosulfuronedens]
MPLTGSGLPIEDVVDEVSFEKYLPVRSRPREDELLLSWMTRLARGNGLKLQSFVTEILGFHPQLLCLDLDRVPLEELLVQLADRVGCTYQHVYETGLWAYSGRLWGEASLQGPVDWIMPMGRSKGDRRRVASYSNQFCSACLCSDPYPYMRRHWRLALSVVCPRHGVYLLDACPCCHGPVEFHTADFAKRLLPEDPPLTRCGKCGYDWRHAVGNVQCAPSPLVTFQSQILTALDTGIASRLPGGVQYSELFFAGLRRLLQLLITRSNFSRIRTWLVKDWGQLEIEPQLSSPRRFENLRVGDRARLLEMIHSLFIDWPESFLSIARAQHVSSSYILDYHRPLPFWLDNPVRMELGDKDYAPSATERKAAKEYLIKNGGRGSQDEVNGILGVSSTGYSAAKRERWNPRGPDTHSRVRSPCARRRTVQALSLGG